MTTGTAMAAAVAATAAALAAATAAALAAAERPESHEGCGPLGKGKESAATSAADSERL